MHPLAHTLTALVLITPLFAFAEPCRETANNIADIRLQEIVRDLRKPVHLTHAGDGSDRLYIVEQHGRVLILEKNRLATKPFLDISDRVTNGGEKGLLSLAFHPDYKTNGLFFVNYTSPKDKLHTVVSRFKRKSDWQADASSEEILLTVDQPYGNHNGGQIAFGPDGFLYIGMGDGGSGNDPLNHGQNTNSLLGAMLRIDVNKKSEGRPYAIPADNPFVGRKNYRPEIWAYGLRNPWRFSFDRGTGRLYAADVGQDATEEIDIISKGGNYGWRLMEGNECTAGIEEHCDKGKYLAPIHTYPHPQGFSITGGHVYRGAAIPNLCGTYLFADYVTQTVWGLRYNGDKVTTVRELVAGKNWAERVLTRFTDSNLMISSFGEDQHGELYAVDHRTGRILKIIAAN